VELTRFNPELVHPTVFIAEGAVVVGDVVLEEDCSVWFNAVLRGDVERLTIRRQTNIQDGCILHTSHEYPVLIDEGVTVGHGAVVHGATIGRNTLIGIRAILLDGVTVGDDCIVAAGSLLTAHREYPSGHLIMGAPATVARRLKPEEIAQNRRTAQAYVSRARMYSISRQ